MSKTTEVTLIRHGETEWNLSGRWQGHADSPLSERGVAQAEALGRRMRPNDFDCFYSSDWKQWCLTSWNQIGADKQSVDLSPEQICVLLGQQFPRRHMWVGEVFPNIN